MRPVHLFLLAWAAIAGGLYLVERSADGDNERIEAQRMNLPVETYRWAKDNSDHAYTACKNSVLRRTHYDTYSTPNFTWFFTMNDRVYTIIGSDLISTNAIGLMEQMAYSCDVTMTGSDWSHWPVTIRAVERAKG